MYMQRTTSVAAGNGLYTTTNNMHGAADIGLGVAPLSCFMFSGIRA